MCIAALVVAMGGAVALIASYLHSSGEQVYMVATGIVAVGGAIIAGEFGLARSASTPTAAVKVDHPVTTINQGADAAK